MSSQDIQLSVGVLLLFIVGCTEPNPRYCGDDECTDPAFPYCDKDGFIEGVKNSCIAVACPESGDFVKCKGNSAISCDANREGYEITDCDMGCNDASLGCNLCTPDGAFCSAAGVQHCGSDGMPSEFESCSGGCQSSPSPHCAYLVPHYLPNICDTPASDERTFSASATLGTDIDSLCTGGIVAQSAAPEICVVRASRITIEQGVTLKVTGTRAIAFVADHSLVVNGVLDVSADGGTDGPGGGSVTSGGGVGALLGGGGAGFKTSGAAGGTSTADGGATNGGSASTNPALLAVLVGGSRSGGGGGGAAVLIACRGSVELGGTIDAGGGGGFGGSKPSTIVRGGAGGGAGGNVVLQGLQVSVTGQLYANGGGGGAGYTGTLNGNTGSDGTRSMFPAPGGVPQASEGAGGAGGAKGVLPAVGHANAGTGSPGGGGSSVGFLQIYTPNNVEPSITSVDISPAVEPTLHVETR